MSRDMEGEVLAEPGGLSPGVEVGGNDGTAHGGQDAPIGVVVGTVAQDIDGIVA